VKNTCDFFNLYKNKSKKIDRLIAQSVDILFDAQNIDIEGEL